jgi:Domain of unknown function (DUF4878)
MHPAPDSRLGFFYYFAKMKAIVTACVVFCLFTACNNGNDNSAANASNDMDAARNFLDAALKGDFSTASGYMLRDSANIGYLGLSERIYKGKRAGEKDSLKASSLRFFDTRQVNDSTTVTVFSNSYMNKKDTLKVLKINGHWLVDLKYLFEHDMDTSIYHPGQRIDTIHK